MTPAVMTVDSAKELIWFQPSVWRRRYELRIGRSVVGRYLQKGMFDSSGVYETEGDRWTVSARGILRPAYTFAGANSGRQIAEFRGGSIFSLRGTLALHSGGEYEITSTNFWGTKYRAVDSQARPAASWRVNIAFSRNVVTLNLERADLSPEDLSTLCLLALQIKITMTSRAIISS